MKLLLLLSVCLLSEGVTAQANWFPADAVWHNQYSDFIANGYTRIQITKDTSIGGIACKKISVETIYVSYPTNSIDSSSYNTYVYQDDNIVYAFLNAPNNLFDTLYNFNTAIGDQWGIFSGNCQNLNSFTQVLDTGSVIINDESLKWMSVNYHNTAYDFWTDTIIEKIGSTHLGLLQQTLCATDPVQIFCSYEDSLTGLYPEDAPLCDTLIFLGLESTPLSTLSILPNPADKLLTISGMPFQDGHLEIYNTTGKRILRMQEVPDIIDISYFSPGIYLLCFSNDRQLLVKKIIRE